MKKKIAKIIAAYLALTMFFEIVSPTVALAITGGPSQVEFESFEPANTTQMVDPFTGDFNYNIPLMTVPGPNGGYPINLAYHAGIHPDQEASWVGLGWNINAGEINRQMRGLPDEFNGELVTKTLSFRPNYTLSARFGTETGISEILGFRFLLGVGWDAEVYYNNYKGLGLALGFGASKQLSYASSKLNLGLNFTMDSQNGSGLNSTIAASGYGADVQSSVGFNSRDGLSSLGVGLATQQMGKIPSVGYGFNFCMPAYLPSIPVSMIGGDENIDATLGGEVTGVHPALNINASLSVQKVYQTTQQIPAFGYMNSENSPSSPTTYKLMDYNKDKDGPVAKEAPFMPLPIFTNDVYFAKAQGMGTSFRPYRSDLGVLTEPSMNNTFLGEEASIEVGLGNVSHDGVNATLSYTSQYSGQWTDKWDDIQNTFGFKGEDITQPDLFEPFYFKSPQDLATETLDETSRFQQNAISDFALTMDYEAPLSTVPRVKNQRASDASTIVSSNQRANRDKRTESIQYRTRDEMNNNTLTSSRVNQLYPENAYPSFTSDPGSPLSYSTTDPNKGVNHLGEMEVVNPDGTRYVYGLPVYNLSETDVVNSTLQATSPSATRTVSWTPADVSTRNDKGRDHLYSQSTMPGYAHTYLLTAIYSPDYVDLTGNGPSDDDFGYFVKFNYTQEASSSTPYNWRAPFVGEYYEEGYRSDKLDDKAAYTFGSKEIYYLNSIETKTHIAEFTLGTRQDGYGVAGIAGGIASSNLVRELDKIVLYEKNDLFNSSSPTPIKTVNFVYTYGLCPGTPNSTATGGGKLTLHQVYFTERGDDRGSLSPYTFDYHETTSAENPSYGINLADRWGTYKPEAVYSTLNLANEENPYADQTKANADVNCAVWCLKGITLPSGGGITVKYEADDYAYVQNQTATEMYRIVGVGNTTSDYSATSPVNTIFSTSSGCGSTTTNTMVFFQTNSTTTLGTDIGKLIAGLNQVYFKVDMLLPNLNSGTSSGDYVDGFCQVSQSSGSYGLITGTHIGYLTVIPVPAKQVSYSGVSTNNVHPFSKAAWEYLKMKRTDLLYPSTPDASLGASFVTSLINMFSGLSALVEGYFDHCRCSNIANQIVLDQSDPNQFRPSYIRLNAQNLESGSYAAKIGGGHRVKEIDMNDDWNGLSGGTATADAASIYGQTFQYVMPDGTSSGVASYEPITGGEENPMRLPSDLYKSDRDFLSLDKSLYQVLPIGEAYFPAPLVGYRRVIVRPLTYSSTTEINKSTATGTTVHEYYTAYDFPVVAIHSDVTHKSYAPTYNIPFIGSFSFNNNGFSQGYSVEVNDMHGKPRSVATYSHMTDLTNPNAIPVSKTEFNYNLTTSAFDPHSGNNHLSSTVSAMRWDGDIYPVNNMGANTDFVVDMQENSQNTITGGWAFNADCIPLPIPSLLPIISNSQSMYRAVVSNKVISRTGILMEVKQTNEGSVVSTKNLLFDILTGKPLLTQVTNDFDAPVYTYDYAAHWDYNGMQDAGTNYGMIVHNLTASSGYVSVTNAPNFFKEGDQLEIQTSSTSMYDNYVVDQVLPTQIRIKKDDDSSPLSGSIYSLRIIRSGYRNQQDISHGTIVSLSEPVTSRTNSLFNALASYSSDEPFIVNTSCGGSTTITVPVTVLSQNQISFGDLSENYCVATIVFPVTGSIPDVNNPYNLAINSTSDIPLFSFQKQGNHVIITQLSTGHKAIGTWTDANNCYPDCLDGVLHADAKRFSNNTTINYADFNALGTGGATVSSLASANPFQYGASGIWRPLNNWLFQVDRSQLPYPSGTAPATNISTNGTYNYFSPYNWQVSESANSMWSFVSQATQYTPYGNQCEGKDALGIFSSSLYGYDYSAMIAKAHNADYHELAFESFEDYYGGNYTTPASYPTPVPGASHGHGHLNLLFDGTTAIGALTAGIAHTGNYSLYLFNNDADYVFNPSSGGTPTFFMPHFSPSSSSPVKYIVSAWFQRGDGHVPTISVLQGGTVIATAPAPALNPVIDGWEKVDLVFTMPTSSYTGTMDIRFWFDPAGDGGSSGYVDDIRIIPYTATATTYVYDPLTMWLTAELDNNHYATFYNYDDEGHLTQVKKETVNGIATLKSNRSNVQHH